VLAKHHMRASNLLLLTLLLLFVTACAPRPSPTTTVTSTATSFPPTKLPATHTTVPTAVPATPTTTLSATHPSPPATPITLSTDNCPAPAQTYRNEVMGIELPVPEGYRVIEPQYLFAEYGVSLVGPDESAFQAIWLYQRTPAELEAIVGEEMAQLADLPAQRAPLVVAGVEGVMLSPVPGIVAHTAVYLPVDGRLFLLLAPSFPLDDAGRCLLAGLSFFPPTKTLAELRLPTDSGVPGATAPVLPTATLPADPTAWAAYPTYHNDTYGFSFRYPDGRWTLIEPTADNPHRIALAYHELGIALRVGVARAGEDADLQLYGGRAGDFVPLADAQFLGEPISQSALVYQGVTWSVHYNDTRPIARGDLLFSLALISNRNFDQGADIPEEVRAEAEQILATFALDSGVRE